MSSDRVFGDGEEGVDDAAGAVGPVHDDGGDDEVGAGVDLGAQAAEASAWLAECRAARERGEPDHEVGASGIGDPVLGRYVGLVRAGLDGLLGLDPTTRDGKDLLEANVELFELEGRLDAALGQLLRGYEGSMEWALKNRTASARVAHRCRLSTDKVAGQLRLGRNLEGMPLTEEALAAGEISGDHARRLAALASCDRTAEAFKQDEDTLVGHARTLSWRDFMHKLAEWRLRVDQDGPEDDASTEEANRRVHLSEGLDGTGLLDGLLTKYGYAVVKGELERLEHELFQEDWTEAEERLGREPAFFELARTRSQRMHDALVQMAERSHVAGTDGKRSAPLVSIVLGRDAFSDAVARMETTDTIVTPGTVARIFDDHQGEVLVERIIVDGDAETIRVSDQRLFTGKLRRAIQIRDVTCRWPGCHVPAVCCEIDHVVEHSKGGETSLQNGQALCRAHNARHEALSTGWGERTRLRSVVAGCMKLKAARSWRCRIGWEAALTKPGRAGTTRRSGLGERDGEVYDIETSYGTPLRASADRA